MGHANFGGVLWLVYILQISSTFVLELVSCITYFTDNVYIESREMDMNFQGSYLSMDDSVPIPSRQQHTNRPQAAIL
jgi:hypothetical protein